MVKNRRNSLKKTIVRSNVAVEGFYRPASSIVISSEGKVTSSSQKTIFTPSTASLVDWSDVQFITDEILNQTKKGTLIADRNSLSKESSAINAEPSNCTWKELMDSFPTRSPNKATLTRLHSYFNPGIKLLRSQNPQQFRSLQHLVLAEQSSLRETQTNHLKRATSGHKRSVGQRGMIEPDVSTFYKTSTGRNEQNPANHYPCIAGRSLGRMTDPYLLAPRGLTPVGWGSEHEDDASFIYREKAKRELRERHRRELIREIIITQRGLQSNGAPPSTPTRLPHFGGSFSSDEENFKIPPIGETYSLSSGELYDQYISWNPLRKELKITLPSADPSDPESGAVE